MKKVPIEVKAGQYSVWIVEDNARLAHTYKEIIELNRDFVVTEMYHTGEKLLNVLHKPRPDIILMDITLPGKNGVECTAILRKTWPGIKVIMVTVYEDTEMVFDALKAGASGYITKTSNYDQILTSLYEVLNGGAPMSAKIARMVIKSFHSGIASPLTAREQQVLKMVAAGKTFSQVSEELNITRETTKSHIRNIYEKLEVNCRADAITIARQNNYF